MDMRGQDIQRAELFGCGSLEERVPTDHPPRAIQAMVDESLRELSTRFDEIYPEMLDSLRRERMLMVQLEYKLLFRWFVGLSANEPAWLPTVSTRSRDRLLEGAVSEQFFSLIIGQARVRKPGGRLIDPPPPDPGEVVQ
jgi:transposase